MNSGYRLSFIMSAAALVAVAVGCSTVSVQSTHYIAAPNFPSTDPGSVQILQTAPVAPNIRLGEITVQPQGNPSRDMIRQKFQTTAAAWGANAVVIVADQTMVMGATVTGPWWGRSVTPDMGRVIVGIAIRYVQ